MTDSDMTPPELARSHPGRVCEITKGITHVENGLITEELGLDDAVTVLQQLDLIPRG